MRLSLDKQAEHARELVAQLSSVIGGDLVTALIKADQSSSAGIEQQRERVAALKSTLHRFLASDASDLHKMAGGSSDCVAFPLTHSPTHSLAHAPMLSRSDALTLLRSHARNLLALADTLVKKSVWIVGGDGWAYDIGYGGLDHVMASGHKVNILVLDTEVYSNTGGQMSKSTPCGAVAKFAAAGKVRPKKDLALMAMTYRSVYVARVALGANDTQALKAFLEAEAFDGPSLIISYGHCIAHGYDLVHGLEQQKAAVLSGHWPLVRYNPDLIKAGRNPFQLDSRAPSLTLEQYRQNESRYTMLAQSHPEAARDFQVRSQQILMDRWHHYEYLAAMQPAKNGDGPAVP